MYTELVDLFFIKEMKRVIKKKHKKNKTKKQTTTKKKHRKGMYGICLENS